MKVKFAISLLFLSQLAFARGSNIVAPTDHAKLRRDLFELLERQEVARSNSTCEITCTDPDTGESSTCSIECEVGQSANCYCYEHTPTCTCY